MQILVHYSEVILGEMNFSGSVDAQLNYTEEIQTLCWYSWP